MKTKTSKLNILLIAITLLLLFVACFNAFGKTNSWLIDNDEIGFELNVQNITIKVKQGERVVDNQTGFIYLGTDLIEADTAYMTTDADDVTIVNEETTGVGYYIRCQAFAVVNGVSYNINNCITGDLYKRNDNWMYSVNAENENGQMSAEQTITIIKSVKFPASFINQVQGQYFKLHLFIEGSADGTFA